MIRSLTALLIAVLFLIVTIPYQLVMWLLRKKWPYLGANIDYRLVQWILRVIKLPLGIKLEVRGRERIPKEGPVLYIGNHRSYLDVVLIIPYLPRMTGFIAKDELLRFPLLPLWMKNLHCEFIAKDDIKQNLKVILSAIETVKGGNSIFIYPEGTRNRAEDERDLMEFHEGSFKIATKTGCPIVPVSVNNTRERLETQFPKARPGHVIIEFGEPIYTDQLTRQELKGIGAKTRETVRQMVCENHERL